MTVAQPSGGCGDQALETGTGGIQEKPVVKNGSVVPGNTMKVTLSCDHRVVDGVTGSEFLRTFKGLMENPVILLGESSI